MNRRGQVSTFTKIMLAIVASVCFGLVMVALWSYHAQVKTFRARIDIARYAYHIGKILSGNCLVYEKNGVAYAGLLNVSKIRNYEGYGYEPCARNYKYGWVVVIKDLVNGRTYRLGAKSYSFGLAQRDMKFARLPVALKYDGVVNAGIMNVTVIAGDLERVAGLIDRVCMEGKRMGEARDSIIFYADFKTKISDASKEVSLEHGEAKRSRKLECDLSLSFSGECLSGPCALARAENYRIAAEYEDEDGKVKINVERL